MSRRLAILLIIAASVAAWAAVVDRRGNKAQIVEVVAPKRQLATLPGASAASVPTSGFALPKRAPLPEEAAVQAFASRQWVAPPPPPPPVVVAPPPPVVVPPPQPPALPYTFVGMLQTQPGAKPAVFLAQGDKLIVATVGDTLEAGYRLESITGNELVFFNAQWNYTTRLSIEGGQS